MSDYVKMWEELGMDLENHDLLCQVLPGPEGRRQKSLRYFLCLRPG